MELHGLRALTRLAGTEASLDATLHQLRAPRNGRAAQRIERSGFRASCCKVDHPWASLSSDSKEEDCKALLSEAFFLLASFSSVLGSMTSTAAPADHGDQDWWPFLSTATRHFSSQPPKVKEENVTCATTTMRRLQFDRLRHRRLVEATVAPTLFDSTFRSHELLR